MDVDDRVRSAAVATFCDIAADQPHLGMGPSAEQLLNRLRDKKVAVRKEAAAQVGGLWWEVTWVCSGPWGQGELGWRKAAWQCSEDIHSVGWNVEEQGTSWHTRSGYCTSCAQHAGSYRGLVLVAHRRWLGCCASG